VQGRASAPPDGFLRDPITHQPCLWFSVVTEKFSFLDKCRWKTVGSARSSRPFVIDDGSARCLVSPAEIEIDERGEDTVVKERWNLRHRVSWIREGEPVFAIGFLQRTSHSTRRTIPGETDSRDPASPTTEHDREEQSLTRRATEILRSWKQNPKRLLAEFDADGDGKIDAQEWGVARSLARAEAEGHSGVQRIGRTAMPPVEESVAANGSEITHRLTRPPDDRPFLLSVHGEESLVANSRKRSFWGLVFFVIGVITLLSLLHSCFGE
jgi:hypothetical protein